MHDDSLGGEDQVLRQNRDLAALQNSMQSRNSAISHQIELKFGMMALLLEGTILKSKRMVIL